MSEETEIAQQKTPQFLNIDFQIFSQTQLKHLIAHFEYMDMSVLYADQNHFGPEHEFGNSSALLAVEVNTSVRCESILEDFTGIIENLSADAKRDWEQRDGLILDFGFNVPQESKASSVDLPQTILVYAQKLEASVRITTYLESASDWNVEHEWKQAQLQSQLNKARHNSSQNLVP